MAEDQLITQQARAKCAFNLIVGLSRSFCIC